MRDTPVPIPNTLVKTQAADGTALETMWESRWPPELIKKGRFAAGIINIDTDKGEQQLTNVNPISRAVLFR